MLSGLGEEAIHFRRNLHTSEMILLRNHLGGSMATWASVETAKAAAMGTTGVASIGVAGGVAIITGAAMGAGGAPS